MTYTAIADLVAAIEVAGDATVSRTVHQDAACKAVLFAFAAGQELSEHTAAVPAVLYFIDGQARVTLGDDDFLAGPHALVHMPPKLPHSIRAVEPTRMLLLLLKGNATDG